MRSCHCPVQAQCLACETRAAAAPYQVVAACLRVENGRRPAAEAISTLIPHWWEGAGSDGAFTEARGTIMRPLVCFNCLVVDLRHCHVMSKIAPATPHLISLPHLYGPGVLTLRPPLIDADFDLERSLFSIVGRMSLLHRFCARAPHNETDSVKKGMTSSIRLCADI